MTSNAPILIRGTGHCLPEKVVTNADLVQRMNTSEEFILERTGVRERRHARPDQGLSDLMVPAAKAAMAEAGVSASEIDMLIVTTMSPDYHDPSQACLIQPLLGLRGIPAFDIRAQCSGLLYAMEIAVQSLSGGKSRNVLIVCGEMLSKRMDLSDEGRNLSILLGDGVGAAVIGKGAAESAGGLVDLELGADGECFGFLMTRAPGTAHPTFAPRESSARDLYEFRMTGKPMFEHASETMNQAARKLLDKHGLSVDDVDVLIPHQPNVRLLEETVRRLEFPTERCVITADRLGNIGSGSLPIALSIARKEKKLLPGQLALILTYGSGATWGAALYREAEA